MKMNIELDYNKLKFFDDKLNNIIYLEKIENIK